MKIQLFSISDREFNFGDENLGVARIKAFLKQKNIDAIHSYLYMSKQFADEVKKIDCQCMLYGFSIYSDNVDYTKKLIKHIKSINKNAICFAGSKFATLYYETLLEDILDIDFIILGDGEYTINELIQNIEAGNDINKFIELNEHIANRKFNKNKRALSININELPWPDRDYLKNPYTFTANICDSHGCNGKCSFCGLRHDSTKLTLRNAKDLKEEIISIYSKTGIRIFLFTGGSFEIPGKSGKERISEFCDYILESNIKFSFRCFLKAESFKDIPEDKKLLQKMKHAGFNFAHIGIESGSNDDLKVYNKSAFLEDNHTVIKLMQDADIYYNDFGFIMYNPYSTIDSLQQNLEFLKQYKCSYLKKYIDALFISENTMIYNKMRRDGLLKESFSYNNQCDYAFVDKNVTELYNKVKTRICTSNISGNSYYYTLLCYVYFLMNPLIDLKEEKETFTEISNNLFVLLSDFFNDFYYDIEFKDFNDKFRDLENSLNELYVRSNILRKRIIIKYMKSVKMH